MIETSAPECLINHLEKRQSYLHWWWLNLLNLQDLQSLLVSRACFVSWNVWSGRIGVERAKDRVGGDWGEVIPFVLATAPPTHTHLIAIY